MGSGWWKFCSGLMDWSWKLRICTTESTRFWTVSSSNNTMIQGTLDGDCDQYVHDPSPVVQNSRIRRRRFTWVDWRTVLTIRSSTPTSQSSASSPEHSGIQSLPIVVLPVSVADPGCLSRIRIFPPRIPDLPQRILVFYYNSKKMVSKLSEIWSGLLIPDPDFLPNPDPGSAVKKTPDPGSGSATLVPVLSWLVYFDCFIRL
jgi:hypothetical protein